MSSTKVVLNHHGFRALLKSPELAAGLEDLASGIAANAGEGYAADTYQASTRVVASAYTATPEAIRHEAKNNTLLKAMQKT